MTNEREKNAYDQLLQGVQSFVKKCVNESNRDITTTARIVSIQSDGSYNIDLNGVEYKNIDTIGGECTLNEMVRVIIPQGQYNNMFILKGGSGGGGSITPTPSVSGVSSVNGKTGDVTLNYGDVGALSATTKIPTNTSDLNNDSNYVSDSNYNHTDNNYTTADKNSVATIGDKVDKVEGKQLSTNDFTNDLKNKLSIAYDHSQKTSGNPHNVTKKDVGLSNVPNVATNDQIPTFTESTTLIKLTSGEKLSVAFGKISKAITDLINHIANKNNPHEVTKIQVGLGNVGNFKAVSTVASQGLTDTEKVNARANIGAGTGNSNFSGDYADLSGKPTLGTAASKDVPSSGNASTTQVVMGNDTRLTDARKASDVSAWAKASIKPSYTKSEVGLSNVPNVSTNNQTPTFTKADSRDLPISGETLSILLGKILKWFSDLKSVAFSGDYNDLTNQPTNATTNTNGLMSKDDKTKLDGIDSGANKTTVDSELNSTSTNPVQNKVINDALNDKLSTTGTAAKAIADASGNTITTSYASTIEISGDTLTLKSKSGMTLKTVTLPSSTLQWSE